MRIAITDNLRPNLEDYIRWLKLGDDNLDVVKLSHEKANLAEIDRCHGLLLTGGGDVDPHCYQRGEEKGLTRGVDRARDDFEFGVIEAALKQGIPLLGICRGLQVVNVRLGGNLHVDLVSQGYENHRADGKKQLRHTLQIEPNTLLANTVGRTVEVNSAHHQAADMLGRGLRASAYSPDGVIEALEWADPSDNPFFLLVQWHPERMDDFHNRASKDILQLFLSEVQLARKFEVKWQ